MLYARTILFRSSDVHLENGCVKLEVKKKENNTTATTDTKWAQRCAQQNNTANNHSYELCVCVYFCVRKEKVPAAIFYDEKSNANNFSWTCNTGWMLLLTHVTITHWNKMRIIYQELPYFYRPSCIIYKRFSIQFNGDQMKWRRRRRQRRYWWR